MKKVLIYIEDNMVKPTGGPGGYIFNLKDGLKCIQQDKYEFYFLEAQNKSKYEKVFKKLPRILQCKYHDFHVHKQCLFYINESLKVAKIDLDDYDFIHFHSLFRLLSVKDSLKSYKGKIILTSHTPKPPFLEWTEDVISVKEYMRHKKDYDKLPKVSEEAFEIADYIFFPCEEAEEPYINHWNEYAVLREKYEKKFRYILSGTVPAKPKRTREDICKEYNIPMNAFIISYVGRHNITKGYDKLIEIGAEILHSTKDVYFLIAGKQGPIYGLNCEKWIEVGWTDDPASYIAASDIFVLPNKETYFDLVFLEALSAGTYVLASNTGGNRYFKKLSPKAIELFDSNDDAKGKIVELIREGHNNVKEKGISNKRIYQEYFSNQAFAKKYISLLQSMEEGKK